MNLNQKDIENKTNLNIIWSFLIKYLDNEILWGFYVWDFNKGLFNLEEHMNFVNKEKFKQEN